MIRLSILAIVLYCFPLIAQPGFDWQKTIGGSGNDVLRSISIDAEKNTWIAGVSNSNISFEKLENSRGGNDYWITQIDAAGNLIWQKTIGGNLTDTANSMIKTNDGNLVIGGISTSNISGEKTENSRGGSDYWLVKLNAQGNIVWQKTIGGDSSDVLRSVSTTDDGGLILGGDSSSGISGEKSEPRRGDFQDYWIIKLNPTGNIEWQRTLGGDGLEELWQVLQLSDGGYLVAGKSASDANYDKTEDSRGEFDFWVFKLDTSGNTVWQRTIGGSGGEDLRGAVETGEGKIILAGFSDSNVSGEKTENSRGSFDFWVVQLDGNGLIEWQKTIGGSDFDAAYSITQTQAQHFLVGGTSDSNISGEKTENSRGDSDCWIVELDQDGNLMGQKTFGGNLADNIYSIAETGDGELVLGCNSRSGISGEKLDFARGETDYWVVKLEANALGNLSFKHDFFAVYPNPANDYFTLETDNVTLINLTIYDVSGKKLKTILNPTDKTVVDVSELARGIYLVEIESENNHKTVKKLVLN